MLTIRYDPKNRNSIRDAFVGGECRQIVSMAESYSTREGIREVVFSTENIFTAVRLAIVQGLIHHESVQFAFEDKIFSANEYGAIPNWPEGFCDSTVGMAEQLIKLAMQKRQAQRKERLGI